MEKTGNEFIKLNEELLEEIESAIKLALDNSNKEYQHKWDNPLIWKAIVLPELESIIKENKNNPLMLANFQVGLAKHLDNFSLNWAQTKSKQKIINLISQIVEAALKVKAAIQLKKHCKKGHDDNACCRQFLGKRYDKPIIGLPNLPLDMAAAFRDQPKGETLSHVTLYRIIGCHNTPYGHWWFQDTLKFDSKKSWRRKLAIREVWNCGIKYVELKINSKGLNVWSGKAASQQASSNCILPGGAIQIWLDTNMLKNYPQLVPKPIPQWPII